MADIRERLDIGHFRNGIGPRDCKDALDEIDSLRAQLKEAREIIGEFLDDPADMDIAARLEKRAREFVAPSLTTNSEAAG